MSKINILQIAVGAVAVSMIAAGSYLMYKEYKEGEQDLFVSEEIVINTDFSDIEALEIIVQDIQSTIDEQEEAIVEEEAPAFVDCEAEPVKFTNCKMK